MTIDELKRELRAILAAEEQEPPNWKEVERRSDEVVARLATEREPPYPHDVVYHYLEDADARQKSARYGDKQRHQLRDWLSAA